MVAGTRPGRAVPVSPDGHRRGPDVDDTWREDPAPFAEAAGQLEAYWRGELTRFSLPVDLRGTSFQRQVWEALRALGYGTTTTYGALASAIGRPGAARAIAGAVARNPISIVVPCHRVVGADGAATGYAGGLERKRWLLELEASGRSP